jgi:hypothetical protein
LDFQKAFDKVPHERLLVKCRALGIRGKVLDWISEWLTNRRQRVAINGYYSDWATVTSGVPQGSVLGPLLFLIYVNDMDVKIKGLISKFADDTKIGGVLEKGGVQLQEDLDTLCKWAEKWQMRFNEDKCKAIRIGKSELQNNYYLNGSSLKWVDEEKDLGVVIHKSLKSTKQSFSAVKKANRMLGMIARNIKSRTKEIILPLYRSLVRPHLEYNVQFWSPSFKKDVQLIERVQRRATRLITGIRDMEYEQRLRKTGLFSLARRRMRGDLIQVYKFYKGIDRVNMNDLFTFSEDDRTRGHCAKLFRQRCRLDCRKNFFTNRVVGLWNSLPDSILQCSSVDAFKKKVDYWLDMKGIL